MKEFGYYMDMSLHVDLNKDKYLPIIKLLANEILRNF
jgi:hypothetical protein